MEGRMASGTMLPGTTNLILWCQPRNPSVGLHATNHLHLLQAHKMKLSTMHILLGLLQSGTVIPSDVS